MPGITIRSIGGIAALPGGAYPISVFPGERIEATRATFTYQGPAQTLYVCWGLKKSGGLFGVNFDNGNGLQGGAFAASALTVDNTITPTAQDKVISAILTVPLDTPVDRTYDVFIWIAKEPTTAESQFLTAVDTDASIVRVVPPGVIVTNLQIAYVKVS